MDLILEIVLITQSMATVKDRQLAQGLCGIVVAEIAVMLRKAGIEKVTEMVLKAEENDDTEGVEQLVNDYLNYQYANGHVEKPEWMRELEGE
jgi:hypothetical protein